MSHRTRNLVLVVLALAVLLTAASYTLFNMGGSTPGTGEGDWIIQPSSP